MKQLTLIIALLLVSVASTARAADVSLAPPSEISCGSSRADELLATVYLHLMENNAQRRARVIDINGREPESLTVSFGTFTGGQSVTGLRVTCVFETPHGTQEHRMTTQWNQFVTIPPKDSGSLALVIEGDPLAGTRLVRIPGRNQNVVPGTKLTVSGSVTARSRLTETTMATLPACGIGETVLITDHPRGTVPAYCFSNGAVNWKLFSDDSIVVKPVAPAVVVPLPK